jgi:hypothetical protein
MLNPFAVDHLDVERLLAEWRWLVIGTMALVAKTVFGDLFLRDETNAVFWLNATNGTFIRVANSEGEFRKLAAIEKTRETWFAQSDEKRMLDKGLRPNPIQGIGFSIPLVFKESAKSNKPFVLDIYELVSFLGDVARQISECPDGSEVRLRVKSKLQ